MNLLMIYPEYPDTFWSFKHILKFIPGKTIFPPLGLMTVAPLLPKEWSIKLVDMNISKLAQKDIDWADMVFISAMLIQEKSAKEAIKKCSAKTIVMGGPAPTVSMELFEGVDHFVLDEAETTLPMFLEDLKNGAPKKVYASKERPDITKTPVPMWSLINFRDYTTMPVQYSRGCPFNCEFCGVIVMNGRVPRMKTPEQMVNEFQSLYDAGWKNDIFVVDDNFIGNKASVKQMLRLLVKWQKEHGYPFKLFTEASVNLAYDKELLELMRDANFHRVFLGIETPDIGSLKECGKMQNTAGDLSSAVKTIHNHGMQVMGGFIVGFDNDTEKIFKSQCNFIQGAGIAIAMVGLLNALPGTRLWQRLKSEGRILKNMTGENTDGSINFIPKMGRKKLVKGYKKLMARIYSPKHYYKRVENFLKDYKPTVRSRVTFADVNAFTRSTWRIGIISRARLNYWKLLLKTGILRPKSFPVAVELAIMGLHFDKISRKLRKA